MGSTGGGPGPGRRRRLLIAAATVWGVLLLGLAFLSARDGEPTVREQRSLAEATAVVDRAVADLVSAAGPSTEVEGTGRETRTGCRISLIRDGAALTATLDLRAPDADPEALLDRISRDLPERYRAGVRSTAGEGGSPTLRADAGGFVTVRGRVSGPDTVTLTLETGCRPYTGTIPTGPSGD